ncbi:AI-2E family transporter [Chromatocurvus halotolerans]|uniref:Putative PurR-regulated permease PerM n=1 Tax=Chromatocurvus halotolerans TaxID=1132028 RepID=A0A4V2SB78_9GAMM|nr:AI-2E family transporter [Chromatocurvus halotolerans]TCO74470.1 putative PurR-regulated permease PerM [Chromatocurvus halotolerans]
MLFSLVALTALVVIIVWSFGWVLNAFYNLLLSLAIAGVLALVLHPVAEFLEKRLRLPHLLAIVLLLTVFFFSIFSLIALLVPVLVSQAVQLMTVIPEVLLSWQSYLEFHYPEVSDVLAERLTGDDNDVAGADLAGTGNTIMSYLGMFAGIIFMPLFLFFTLFSGDLLRDKASELLSVFQNRTQEKALYFMDVFVQYITAFFQGQLLIAVCMGTLYAISFTLIGLEFGVLVGLVLGMLNIVPFLGTMIGLIVVLPMAYLQPEGGIELLIMTGVVFAAVQLIESWILTPRIMAERSGLHPALVIISLFFWGTALNGVIGMILAVPLTAFFVAIWSEIKASLVHTLSSRETKV